MCACVLEDGVFSIFKIIETSPPGWRGGHRVKIRRNLKAARTGCPARFMIYVGRMYGRDKRRKRLSPSRTVNIGRVCDLPRGVRGVGQREGANDDGPTGSPLFQWYSNLPPPNPVDRVRIYIYYTHVHIPYL